MRRLREKAPVMAAAGLGWTLLVACTPGVRDEARDAVQTPEAPTTTSLSPTLPSATVPTSPPSTSEAPPATAAPTEPADQGPEPSDGAPVRARISVPAADISDLVVEPYAGRTDDGAGTKIQDGGVAASPHGRRGGVGPGGIGNYQVTAHRLSSTKAFLELPDAGRGDRVVVEAAGTQYIYRITETRRTSFREPASLKAQRAAVPGRPGVAPTRAMITLSTCATPEDHAKGNYWSDRFGNPEHRIDKIGMLVKTSPA